jgi:hypothetical protein
MDQGSQSECRAKGGDPMTGKWTRAIGQFLVRRLDDGELFDVLELSTFHEEQTPTGIEVIQEPIKAFESTDGRFVSTSDEKDFYFADESWRPMQRLTLNR